MQAELRVERIERRLSLDEVADADWLRTETDTSDNGQLRIVKSCRYSNEDIRTYGAAQVQEWVDEDHRRYAGLGEDWWFVDALAVAVIGVQAGEEQLGTFTIFSGCVGGIESDAPLSYYDELTHELVGELKEQLAAQGLSIPENLETPYVCSQPCLVQAL
jgi:hypothetical protein